ncbi:uncharacterized protein [Palaemon carinicauda]|uniref:uncharacterized protein n=1 Tax=Palaemon carinicauda TaxID=392227 RepID=UPI0035B5F7E9
MDFHTPWDAPLLTSCLKSSSGQGSKRTPGNGRFGHILINVVGPFPPSRSARYLLTIIDRSTRWLEASSMTDVMTQACAEALLSSWVSRFGVPDDITTDKGPAFLPEIWRAQANLMGTTLHSTTAYNPAANGMVERTHRALKASLMASCTDGDRKSRLPWVLSGLRTAPRADGEPSPAEKLYGEVLALSKDLTTKVDALMDSHLTTFKAFINASTPDEEDNFLTSTEADVNTLEHMWPQCDVPERG